MRVCIEWVGVYACMYRVGRCVGVYVCMYRVGRCVCVYV